MQKTQKNGFLFGVILSISFLIVVALWLPSAKSSFVGILTDVGSGAKSSSGTLQNQWSDAQDIMNNLFPKGLQEDDAPSTTSLETRQEVLDALKGALSSESSSASEVKQQVQDSSPSEKKFCTRQGGVYQTRVMAESSLSYGICVFSNGSECDASMFEYNKCHIGQYTKAEDGIPKKPDLMFTKATVYLCHAVAGEVCAEFIVKNRGRVTSPQTNIQSVLGILPIQSLKPGDSVAVKDQYNGVSANAVLETFTIDQNNTIQEIIEENNSYRIPQK